MIFKNKILYLIAIVATLACACNDFEEDAFNFDNSFPQYVDFSAGSAGFEVDTIIDINGMLAAQVGTDTVAIADLPPATVSLSTRLRVARQTATNVTVEVTGGVTETFNLTIPADEFEVPFTINLPYGPDNLNGSATATIASVDDGLTIGRTVPSGSDPIDVTVASITWTSN